MCGNGLHNLGHLHKPGVGMDYITLDIFKSLVREWITLPKKLHISQDWEQITLLRTYSHKPDVGIVYITQDIFISQVWERITLPIISLHMPGWERITLPRTFSQARCGNGLHYLGYLHKPGVGMDYITQDIYTSQVWECITLTRTSSQAW